MAKPPQFLTLDAHRDDPHHAELVVRRVLLSALTLLALLALLDVLGQSPTRSESAGDAASLEVVAPDRLRGGLFYEGLIVVHARRDLEHATLALDRAWFSATHINTYSPEPVELSWADGRLVLDYGALAAGETLEARLELQVNPTNVGRRSQGVRLQDGDELLAAVDRTLTVLP